MSLSMANKYGGVGMVSAGWVLMAYAQMPFGPTAGMVAPASPGQKNWGNRIFMNMDEQAPMFFASLWGCAIFVDPKRAAKLGATYLAFRAAYAPIWLFLGGEKGNPQEAAMFTFPQYSINVYSSLAVLLKVGLEKDISSFFFGSDALGVFALTAGYMGYAVGLVANLNAALKGYFVEAKSK